MCGLNDSKVETNLHSRLIGRSPIYYGWVVWAVGALGMVATAPGQSFSVSLFFDHFIADFGLSRTLVSTLYGAGTLVASASLIFVGRAIDRYGNRKVGLAISLLFALALAAFSLITGPLGLLVGFTFIRGLGQGALFLNSGTAIAKWFRRRRGLLMSMATFSFIASQSAYVLVVSRLIERIGWRATWISLS